MRTTLLFILLCIHTCCIAQTTSHEVSYYDTDTIFYVNGDRFYLLVSDPDIENSDTLQVTVSKNYEKVLETYIPKGGLYDLILQDFDIDGTPDIWFNYGQQMGDHILFLFNGKKNQYEKDEGFSRFREPIKLKSNPKYYYSYCRAGCADMNWTSRLFTFRNHKSIEIGYIYGNGCEDDIDFPSIKIYETQNNSEETRKLLKEYAYKTITEKYGDKWSFIEEYWNENYQKFIK